MSPVVVSLLTIVVTGLLGYVFGFRKQRSEVELNQVTAAKTIITASLELSEEVKQFYEIRTAFLEQRIVALEKLVDGIQQENLALKAEILELKGRP